MVSAIQAAGVQVSFSNMSVDIPKQEVDRFVRAILDKQADNVTQMLKVNSNLLNVKNEDGLPPLIMAATVGSIEVCSALLSAGADPRSAGPEGRNGLHVGAYDGNVEVIEFMLKACRELIDSKDNMGMTPLMLAAFSGHSPACTFLLKANAHPDILGPKNCNALHFAANAGNPEAARVLCEANNLLLETKDEDSYTPLLSAAAQGHAAVCTVLLQARANIAATTKEGFTPLMVAATGVRWMFVKYCCKRVRMQLLQAKTVLLH